MMGLVGLALMAASTPLQCPHLLLERDAEGRIVRGSEARVVDAVRSGARLRIGWYRQDRNGHPTVVHWVDGSFLTERGGHVYAQFGAIHSQRPQRDPDRINLSGPLGIWYGLASTEGVLQGRPHDKPVRASPAPMVWCESPESFRDRCTSDWRAIYRNDAQGAAMNGSKAALLAAVQAGRPLRMAWGGRKDGIAWAHSAEPVFVTVTREAEVIAQLPEHLAQQSYHDARRAYFIDESWLWRGLLSTTGAFDAAWVHRGTGAQMLRLPQRAAVTWLAWVPPAGCDLDVVELSIPGGVVRDPQRKVVDKRPKRRR